MKIQKIEAQNYRGFKKLNLSFDENINLLVGVNGSGKSSILDLVAMFLNTFVIKLLGKSSRELDYALTMFDINIEAQETIDKIVLSTNKNNNESNVLTWEIKRDFKGGKSNYKKLNAFVANYQASFRENENQSVPIFKYFHAQRSLSEKDKSAPSKKRYIAEQFKAYEGAFDRAFEFDKFMTWFLEEENKENRKKVSLKDFSYTNKQLESVRQAITSFLGNFPAVKYENLRVEDRPFNVKSNEKSAFVIDKNGQAYNLKQLSDGEKSLILMVADIAYRLALANPNAEYCLTGEGIILIDEIDLHLHPAWQREVIPCLTKTFPNIQFLATTHSPQVLSNVSSDKVYLIEDFEIVLNTPPTYGNDSNTILEDLFEVNPRPLHTESKFNKFYELLDAEEYVEASKILEGLKQRLGSQNSEVLRASLHYDFQKPE